MELILSECRPSFARVSLNVISPAPVNDQEERSSMLSSTRESRTFLFSHRNSAPSSNLACIGISGTFCCAARNTCKHSMLAMAAMQNRRTVLPFALHVYLTSMIRPLTLCENTESSAFSLQQH